MKERIKRFFGCIRPYAIPGLITFAVMVFTYICKGIWPFGGNRIDYFDNMQQVGPLYTHLWDWLHGNAYLWFDWYTGLGTNVSMSVSAFSMLSPFNLLLYVVPRDLVLESISILTLVKMTFMSVAMYVLLNKKFPKLQYCMKVTFAVMYSFCGYVILYGSCFTPWMDIVALFPVLMLAYEHMMETGKKLYYILMVALCFIVNYYLSAMVVIYIFLISGAYMLIICERKKWKEHAWNLGIGTATGIGLSAFVLIPVMMQLSNSQRGSSGQNLVGQYMGWVSSSFVNDGTMAAFQRWMMLYGMAFIVAVICIGIRRCWSDKKHTAYMGSLVAIVVLPVIVEGTNLIWHFGSYNGYTLRNGFLIAFTLITVAAYYAERMFADIVLEKKYMIHQMVIAAVICLLYVLLYHLIPDNNEVIAIIFFMAIFVAMTIVYIRKLNAEKENFNCKSVIAVIAVEVFIGVFSLVGPPKFYTYEAYQVGDYVQYANQADEQLQIESSATDRIVNPDISLNANYPLILRRSALSSFTAALQSDTQYYAKKWGYSKYFLWLLDSGGTVFTNALFHVTEAVNVNPLDSNMYTLERTVGNYNLYSTNYQLPFAMCVNSTFLNADLGNDWVSMHNAFYKALSSDTQDLVTGMAYSMKRTDTSQEYTVNVTDNGALYIRIADKNNMETDANSSWLISSMHIYVNDELVTIPTLGDVSNTAYFTDYNNNLIYLGCYKDKVVHIRIEYDDPWYLKVSDVQIAQLNMDKMASLCESLKNSKCDVSYTNNSLTVNMKGSATKNYALIPVVYSDNWKVTVDGVAVKTSEIAGMFTAVKVHSGDNTIVMTFTPKGLKEGMLVSLAVLLLLMVCLVINHFQKIKVASLFKYCAIFIYLQLFNAIIVAMFLVPSLTALPAMIYQIVLKLMKLM